MFDGKVDRYTVDIYIEVCKLKTFWNIFPRDGWMKKWKKKTGSYYNIGSREYNTKKKYAKKIYGSFLRNFSDMWYALPRKKW